MSGFVAGGSSAPFTLSNDGFWPDIDADHLRAAQRIPASVTNPRLEVASVAAIISVNRELSAHKLQWQAAGHATLADVPADQINGQSILLVQYQRAIYCSTSVEVSERYRSFDTTSSGDKNAEELTPTIDELRRDVRWAIRDLLGIGRSTIELI
jgi:hypothetical protein